MNCEQVDLDVVSFDEPDSHEAKRVVEHLEQCESCRQRLDQRADWSASHEEFVQVLRGHSRIDLESETSEIAIEKSIDGVEWSVEIRNAIGLRDPNGELNPSGRAGHGRVEANQRGALEEALDLSFLEPASHPELLGKLGRYDIECLVGRGGMGVVFRAHDRDLHRVIALKVLARHLAHSGAARQRFAREARAAAAILHPNVLPIYDVNVKGNVPYLVMQYVSGESLQTRVDRDGPLPIEEVLRIAKQTAEALAAAHQQGLIHRDVKPANILLEEGTDRVVLGDFGLARATDDASLTQTGVVTGTPSYMSPEQAKGEAISPLSDLFAMGSVMYFMLSGHPPFRAETTMGVLNHVCHSNPAPIRQVNSAVPIEVARVVDGLMRKAPSRRIPTAHALADRLAGLLAELQAGNLRIGVPISLKWLIGAGVAIALLLASGLLMSLLDTNGSLPQDSSDTASARTATESIAANADLRDEQAARGLSTGESSADGGSDAELGRAMRLLKEFEAQQALVESEFYEASQTAQELERQGASFPDVP